MTQVTRRQFVVGAGAAGLGLLAGCGRLPGQAAAPTSVPRLGFVGTGVPGDTEFPLGLLDLGYVEGQNITTEYRYAGGVPERLPDLVAELVASRVDVIVVNGNRAAVAAQAVTGTVPIVATALADPVGAGLVASLGHPGGNVTGPSADAGPEMAGKRIELLTETVPGISHVAVLWDPADPASHGRFSETQAAARALGIAVQSVTVSGLSEFSSGFEAIVQERAQAVAILGTPVPFENRRQIADFAAQNRLPGIATRKEFSDAGLLMAYGPSFAALARRAAVYVDRILKGAKPADLPVEQPMTFEFVVNMKTARELGITFPNEIMLQVTEVIQ